MSSTTTRLGFAACLVAALTIATACGDSWGTTAPSTSDAGAGDSGPIIIGAAVASTGFMESFDTPDMTGFKLAMNEVNAAGGIDGRQVQLIEADSASTTDGAKAAAEDLISKGAQVLLVTANFDLGSPAGIAAQDKNILNVSIGAASPKYGPQGIGPQAYTVAPATYLEGASIAEFFNKQGWTKPFMLDDTSLDYSSEVCQGFKDRAQQLNMTLSEDSFKNADQSIASQITKIKSSGADAIALCSYTPGGATALRQLRAAGVDLPTASGIGMAGTYWLDAVPDLSDFYTASTISIFGDDPDPKVNQFVKDYTSLLGTAPTTDAAAGGYAAGQMIFNAIKASNGATDGPTLSAQLDTLTNEPLLAGPTTYTPELHIPADRPLKIIKYTNGKPAYDETVTVGSTVDLHLS